MVYMPRAFTRLLPVYIFMAVVFVFFAAPLAWLIITAFDPEASAEFHVPKGVTTKWFSELIKPVGGKYAKVYPWMWIVNSLIISTAVATLVTALSVLSAFSLTRYSFRGQSAVLNLFIILRLMPPMVIAVPIVVLFAKLALVNTYHGLILVMSALILPFTLLIADGYFRTIPSVYEEAAMVDGCSRLKAFLKITLPLATPGIVTIWLLAFVTAWGEFLMPLVLIGDPYLYPASIGIYYWFGMYGRIEYGRICAFSIVYSIPSIVVFLITRKYLQRGIAGLVTR